MTGHDGFYSRAEVYDVAFSFKDVAGECDFLLDLGRELLGREPVSFLELAAGPATHARELARRGLRAVALDLCPESVAYGAGLASAAGHPIDYRRGDMTDFTLETPVDFASILMDSTSYLLDNDAFLDHLRCVADALVPGGIHVLEMGHPRDVFRVGKSAGTDWTMTRDGLTVHTTWGAEGDAFDPTTQVTETTVRVAWERGDEQGEIVGTAAQRCFGPNEVRGLVAASGRFEIARELGAMDLSIPLSNERPAWRMVPVLRKTARVPHD